MSRVYFHDEHGRVEILGSERHWCSAVAEGAAIGAFRLDDIAFDDHWIFRALRPAISFDDRRHLGWTLRSGSHSCLVMPNGVDAGDTISVLANPAIVLGSPAVQFAARLNASCEAHLFVEGENRAWLADVVDAGLCA